VVEVWAFVIYTDERPLSFERLLGRGGHVHLRRRQKRHDPFWHITAVACYMRRCQPGRNNLYILDLSTTVTRIAAPVVLAASIPLGALAIPNPIFTSMSPLVRQASELTRFDVGLLSGSSVALCNI
jgi:hypothetical protein